MYSFSLFYIFSFNFCNSVYIDSILWTTCCTLYSNLLFFCFNNKFSLRNSSISFELIVVPLLLLFSFCCSFIISFLISRNINKYFSSIWRILSLFISYCLPISNAFIRFSNSFISLKKYKNKLIKNCYKKYYTLKDWLFDL